MPRVWKDVVIIMINKNKDRNDCGNYRGVSLVTHAGKNLLKVVAGQLGDLPGKGEHRS
ncbi:unnamed protein product [Choristocarpus tenellus]